MTKTFSRMAVVISIALPLVGCVVTQRESAYNHGRGDPIGVATMSADGVFHIQLHVDGPGDIIGESYITIAPGDPRYDEVKRHIGDIKPGEEKVVQPWPKDDSVLSASN